MKYQELRDALEKETEMEQCLAIAETITPDTLRALLADADRADALEKVLIDLMNSTGGGKKACGHSFTCGCAWKAARAALSQGEQDGINQV